MMMSREEVHIRQHRDRLLALAESNAASAHKPNNQKRRTGSANKSPLRFGVGGKSQSGPKLSIQDFVRADPGYTPNIEHLVFPDRRKASPVKAASQDSGKTRSRLAEMFALSRHLQQRSADRENKRDTGSRKQLVNRSVDSISTPIPSTTTSSHPIHPAPLSNLSSGVSISTALSSMSTISSISSMSAGGAREPRPEPRRWATTEESHQKQPQRVSPSGDGDRDKRGSNVSILHLRSTSEPWETSPTSIYPPSTRSYTAVVHSTSVSASSSSSGPVLTKHQSLGGTTTSQQKKQEFISSSQISSGELFSCSRELSPVRWCDREVDGVYLGRSGWVQVQQRSLDENRRNNYGSNLTATNNTNSTTSSLPQSRRPNIKLADYHSASEPGIKRNEQIRPAYLPLLKREVEFVNTTPSPPPPPPNIPESFSPPPITPIISPPPAFQDRITKTPRSRPVYGKPPFLPRSNAIDTDIISPPTSPPHTLNPPPPPINWGTLPEPRTTPNTGIVRRPKLTPSPVKSMPLPSQITSPYNRIPQAKSMEEAGTNRRSQFLQRYKDSSSSSSSSLGFRSLDSCVSRPAMPRLSEHTDSLDMYEDADEEDNNSSSLNLSNVSSVMLNSSPDSILDRMGSREKTSPSGRSRFVHHRSQRRSPAQETNKQVTCSSPSSSSSGELTIGNTSFPARSPSGNATPFRRSAPTRQHTIQRPTPNLQDEHRVRRSRSLQLPEKRSPGSIAAYREHTVVPPTTKLSPQQTGPEPHRFIVKVSNNETRPRRPHPMSQPQSLNEDLDEEMLREAEVVTEFLYGSRSRAAAKALLLQRYHERQEVQVIKEPPKPVTNNGFNLYFVNNKRQKPLQRGATTPNLTPAHQTYQTSPTTEVKSTCSSSTCDFWPHCGQREPIYAPTSSMKPSQSYPTHQRPPEPIRNVTPEPKKRQNGQSRESRLSPDGRFIRRDKPERRLSPMSRSPSGGAGNSSCSSSSSDIWLTTSDRTITRSPRDASTPLDDAPPLPTTLPPPTVTIPIPKEREMILTRPGSAPADVEEKVVVAVKNTDLANSQQRSMSLPKSFLSGNGVGTNRHR